jgi:hypothetical protein
MALNLNFGGVGGAVTQMFLSPLIWLAIIGAFLILVVGLLWVRKQKRLNVVTFIFTEISNGKQSIQKTKSGWFKSKSVLGGLYDYSGEQIMKTKDGRIILGCSSVDFHDFQGKQCLLVKRKSDDPKLLVPLTRMKIENEHLLGVIAPADFRDAATACIDQTNSEMRSKWEQYIQWAIFIGVIIFALVSIILITQMVSRGQDKAAELIIQAGKIVSGGVPSTTAP